MPSSSTSSASSARERPRRRDRLGIPSFFHRLSRGPTSSVRSDTPPPAESLPSTATSPQSPADIDTDNQTATPADASATSTTVTSQPTAYPNNALKAPSEAPLAKMWSDAVAEFQQKTEFDFLEPRAARLCSKAALETYIAEKEKEEHGFDNGEWEKLRGRVDPLARILEKLCNSIGDTISSTLPASKIVFAALGLLVSAYIRIREDFAQIGEAFDEMKFHLQAIETVANSRLGHTLHESCVRLLTQVLAVLGVITKMRREGCLRKSLPLLVSFWSLLCAAGQWLGNVLSQTRPLTEALQTLRLLANKQQQAIVGVTLVKITQSMENIATDKVTKEWMHGCLVDVLQATRVIHDLGTSTQAEVIAHRTALRRMELVLYKHSDKLKKINTFTECEQIKGWLNYIDPSYRLRKLLDDRAEGTGSWFLDGDEFAALKEGKTKAVLLSGKAGSGKSTIIAAAVEALRAYHASDSHSLVLAHVFDSTNVSSDQRDLHALLSTLLCQLALNSTHCASIISESHKTIEANGLPTKPRMEELFMETLRTTSLHIIVVVDALDESSDENGVVSFLRRLEAISAISVLVSRRPVIDSARAFGVVVSMDHRGENNNIGLFLDFAMAEGGDLEHMQLDREGVRAKLRAGAEGNFRWLALVIQELKEVAGIPAMVLRRLQSLPSSLRALYHQRLDSIRDDARDDVRRLLLWLVHSEVPLPLHDFAEIMSFDYSHDTPIYCSSYRPLPEAVINLVGSMFISVHEGTVRLAHASVRDFLLGLAPESPFFICKDTDYALMARTVFAYLTAIDQMASLDPQSPLTSTWVYYVHKAGSELYDDLLKEVISVTSKVAEHPIGTAIVNQWLWTAAKIGHHQLVAALVDDGGVKAECATTCGLTSLHLAAANGHLAVISMLFERGAAITVRDVRLKTPLLLAAYLGQDDTVQWLLDHGAHIEDCDEKGYTSLHFASQEGHLGIANLLLERGAAISARTNQQHTPLAIATLFGQEHIVHLLLDKRANIEDCDEYGFTSLHRAAASGDLDIITLLLARGAHIAARSKHQDTPLSAAAYCGRDDAVHLLLDKGADIKDRNEQGWTSLHFAAQEGHPSTVNLLLERGAHITGRTKQQVTPLMVAACHSREDVIRLLLNKGANIEDFAENGWTSLHYATRKGYFVIARLLLERGASVAVRTKQQDTPLTIAARNSREDIVRLLLDKGADIEDCDEYGWTSLHEVAGNGHLGTVSLLLERGAHIAARTKQQDTPLTTAADYGREDVVRLLLDKGAHIEERDEDAWTSLHSAAQEGHLGTARLLLERGASITARTNGHDTPLIMAAQHGREKIVCLLLDEGAHVEECDENGLTSLHAGAWNGHLVTVNILLERVANVNALNHVLHTPLHLAAQRGYTMIIECLVGRGSTLEARDEDGCTPLYLAVYGSKEEAIKVLLSLGSDPHTRADDGTTLLDTVGRSRSLSQDTERDARVRELLVRAGCTERTGKIPLEGGVLPENAEEDAERS